jgi:hypothetical protein
MRQEEEEPHTEPEANMNPEGTDVEDLEGVSRDQEVGNTRTASWMMDETGQRTATKIVLA